MFLELKCSVCEELIYRQAAEVRRNAKANRKVFCSLICAGKVNYRNAPKPPKGVYPVSLVGKIGIERDKYSPFRFHLRSVRRREKVYDISLEDLRLQWENQKGKCPYTGWVLDNPISSSPKNFVLHPRRASLDRIDSTKGYVKGNIQFVSLIAQYAKNSFTEDQLYEFCEEVTKHQKYKIKDFNIAQA